MVEMRSIQQEVLTNLKVFAKNKIVIRLHPFCAHFMRSCLFLWVPIDVPWTQVKTRLCIKRVTVSQPLVHCIKQPLMIQYPTYDINFII